MIELSFWILLKHLHRVYLTDCLMKTVIRFNLKIFILFPSAKLCSTKYQISNNITLEILTCNDAGGNERKHQTLQYLHQ